MRVSPSTVLAGAALFFALGGSAVAVTEAVKPQARCQPGAVRGYIAVNGDPAKGIANLPDQFTSAKPEIGARFNCAGAAPQARRVNVGRLRGALPGERDAGRLRQLRRPRRRRSATSAAVCSGSTSGCRVARTPSTRRSASSPCRRLDRSTTPISSCATPRTRSSWSSGVHPRPTRSGTRSGSTSVACAPAGGASTTPMPSCCNPAAESSGWPPHSPPSRRPSACTPPDRSWFANCAWDAFGICAALHVDGRIETECPDCGDPITVDVRDERPDDESLLFHCLVPAARWWDDIGFT